MAEEKTEKKTCQNCKRCDNINHAPIGSGEYRPWCIVSPGHYKKIENWTQPCDGWEATK